MRYIAFSELSCCDVCISEILCAEYHWKNRLKNEYPYGREQNILSFTLCRKKQLFEKDATTPLFDCDGASIFFVAARSPYISKSFADDVTQGGQTICVRFKMTDSTGEELMISDKYLCWQSSGEDSYVHLFRALMNGYMRAKPSNLNIKAVLYRILNDLSKSLEVQSDSEDNFQDLAPALKYLATDLGNNLSITEIAQLCFMSASYFHKRFKTYTGGETFVEYRNKLRVEKAKELLENPMWSISMVSQSLGFYDTSHFYRVYKKYMGEAPEHIKKNKQTEIF